MKPRDLLKRLGTNQANVHFADLVRLVEALGFVHDRTTGSHQIFIHRTERQAQLNLQPDKRQAKPYQVKQLLKLVEEYNLRL